MAEPVVELAGVARTYPGPPPVTALRRVDLSVHRGEVVAVVGALDETAGTARIDLTAEVDGTKVLGRAILSCFFIVITPTLGV